MRKAWIITSAMVVSMAQAQPPVKFTGGFHHPESVCQSGNNLFVSDIGEGMDPAAKDGDGYIGKIDLSTGKLVDAHFLPVDGTLNAPKGMAMNGNTLYIADVDRIVAFDVVSRKRIADIVITGTVFLNDLVMGDGKLYASATDNGKIYEIDLKTFHYAAMPVDSIAGANGLYFDAAAQRLYCVSIGNWAHPDGTVYAIDVRGYKVKKLTDYKGLLDGVVLVGNTLYFSDWKSMKEKGLLLELDLNTHVATPLEGEKIAGPADFSISKDGKYFIIPEMLEGKILYRPLTRGK
jgi:outer membrane protein assembly factor BamB